MTQSTLTGPVSTANDGSTLRVDVLRLQRLNNTRDGNPQWRIYTDRGIYLIEPNSQLVHALDEQGTGSASITLREGRVIRLERE